MLMKLTQDGKFDVHDKHFRDIHIQGSHHFRKVLDKDLFEMNRECISYLDNTEEFRPKF